VFIRVPPKRKFLYLSINSPISSKISFFKKKPAPAKWGGGIQRGYFFRIPGFAGQARGARVGSRREIAAGSRSHRLCPIRVQGSGFWVQGSEFSGSGFRVLGSGFKGYEMLIPVTLYSNRRRISGTIVTDLQPPTHNIQRATSNKQLTTPNRHPGNRVLEQKLFQILKHTITPTLHII